MTEEQKLEATRAICDVVRGYILNQPVAVEINQWDVIKVAQCAAAAIISGCLTLNTHAE